MAILPTSLAPSQESDIIEELPRGYFGMSQIGSPCKRYLWYTFRWAYVRELTRRDLRIFERGSLEEPRILKDLRDWGYEILIEQENYVAVSGHFKGHSDGIIRGFGDEDMVLEIKTMNAKAFALLLKDGIQKSKPGYYAQAQMYMHFSGLKKTLFIVVNKDTEHRHYCTVDYDESVAVDLVRTAEDIVIAEEPPAKIGGPAWFECKFCAAYEICQFNQPWHKTCRTCVFAEIHDEGRWYCTKHDRFNSEADQREGCPEFTRLPVSSSEGSE